MNQQLFEKKASIGASTLLHPTRDMVRSRTLQLATNAGRGAHQIRQSDYEQAKRELTGELDFDRQQAVLDGRCPKKTTFIGSL
jgi:hypothetical protein